MNRRTMQANADRPWMTAEERVQYLCVLYLCIWSTAPPLQLDSKYRLIALGAAAVWFVLSRKDGFTLTKREGQALLFLVVVVFVNVIQNDGSFSKVLSQISLYMMFIGFLMVNYYRKRMYAIRNLGIIILLLLIVWNFRTFYELAVNPAVARAIVRDDEATYTYLRQGVGGYGLIYSQVCVFPLVLMWGLNVRGKNAFRFVIGCGWLASYILLILKAGYSIAIASTVISVFVLFVQKKESAWGTILWVAVLFTGGLLLILKSEGFRNMLLTVFDGTKVTKKINDLVSSATDGAAEGSIRIRLDRYKGSVQTFFQYPLTGGLWWASGGGHSAVMDVFAKYGFLGGRMYLTMFQAVPNCAKEMGQGGNLKRVSNALTASYLVVGLLDSVPYQLTMMLTVFALSLFSDMDLEKVYHESFVDR